MPWFTIYDYVKVEKYNMKTGDFDFYWQDDFESFDSERWLKSEDKTTEGNSSTFYGNQVHSQKGSLVIKMDLPGR